MLIPGPDITPDTIRAAFDRHIANATLEQRSRAWLFLEGWVVTTRRLNLAEKGVPRPLLCQGWSRAYWFHGHSGSDRR